MVGLAVLARVRAGAGLTATVVVVAHAESVEPSAQLDEPTITLFVSDVEPVGKDAASVTEKVSVAEPPGAIEGIVQLRVPAVYEQPSLQSLLYVP